MKKKYVIEGAEVSCQYGNRTSTLKPSGDRHICVGQCRMGNEADIESVNFSADFGGCRSPYQLWMEEAQRDMWGNSQQFAAYGVGDECQIEIPIPWQNSRKDVRLGSNCAALMEDGWTICDHGFGIISVINSGQAEEDAVQTMQERLRELEEILDAYMKENGIKDKEREGLLESVLLWNGYRVEDKPWDYETSDTNRAFCTYLERENPSLFNYFERGLYLEDKDGETIDVSYMLGINKALNYRSDKWECVSKTLTEDRGMYNGYLEACRQDQGLGTGELLENFLGQMSRPDYNGAERYTAYTDEISEEMRAQYCNINCLDRESLSQWEQDRGVLENMISGRIEYKMYSDKEDTGERLYDQMQQARTVAGDFLEQLEQDRGRRQ